MAESPLTIDQNTLVVAELDGGIGVKRHRYDCVFNGSFHAGLSCEIFLFFLPAATNSAGSGQRCLRVNELLLAAKQ